MDETSLGRPLGDVVTLAEHFYRLVRHGPGLQQIIREHASLDALREELRSLLEDLEPGTLELHAHAVALTGTRDGEVVYVTVQFLVAQPTDPWGEAAGGPLAEWSAWHDVVIREARAFGW